MSYTKKMNEDINEKVLRAEKIVENAQKENRALTDDEKAEIAEIHDDVMGMKKTLEEMKDILTAGSNLEADDRDCGDDDPDKRSAEQRAADDAAALDEFIRDSAKGIQTRANFDKGGNGAIAPTTISRDIVKRVYDLCPILERAQKYTAPGKFEVPYYDETDGAITVAYVDEFEEATASAGKFTAIELTSYDFASLSLISKSLLNNTQLAITPFIVDDTAYKHARFIEGELLNGTTGKIDGLKNMTNTMTAASTSAITADEVIQLKDKVKDVYQTNAIWIMSPGTRTALRLLKDDVGRYLLQDDINAPFGSTLLGKPIYVSDNMPDIAAGKRTIIYGDLTGLGTKFVEEMNIQVLREKYATMHAIGIVGWLEFDAKVIDNQKIAALVQAAS